MSLELVLLLWFAVSAAWIGSQAGKARATGEAANLNFSRLETWFIAGPWLLVAAAAYWVVLAFLVFWEFLKGGGNDD